MKLTTNEQGITIEGTRNKTTTEWVGIRKIVCEGDYVLIFIDRTMAHYVPTAAIGNEAEVAKFLNNLKSFMH